MLALRLTLLCGVRESLRVSWLVLSDGLSVSSSLEAGLCLSSSGGPVCKGPVGLVLARLWRWRDRGKVSGWGAAQPSLLVTVDSGDRRREAEGIP